MSFDERVDVFADAGITQSDLEAAWEIVKNGPARRMVTVEEYDAMWYPFCSPYSGNEGRAFAHYTQDHGMPQMFVTLEDGQCGCDDIPMYEMSVSADATVGGPKELLPILAGRLSAKEMTQQCRFINGGIGPGDGTHNLNIKEMPSPEDLSSIGGLIRHHSEQFRDQVMVASSVTLEALGLSDGDRFEECEVVAVEAMDSVLSVYPRGHFRLRHNTQFNFRATAPKSIVTASLRHGHFGQTQKIETPALYTLSEWVSLTLAADRTVFRVSWTPEIHRNETDVQRAMREASNLGVASDLYEEARKFWLSRFPGLTVDALLMSGTVEGSSLEGAITDLVATLDAKDQQYAAKMLMAVVTYTMGFG